MQTHQVRWAPLPARPRTRPRSPSVPPVPPAPPTWGHTDAQRCCGDSVGSPRRPPWPSVSCVSLACEGMPHSSFPQPSSLQTSRARLNPRMEERSHQCCVREVLDLDGRPVSRTRTTVVKQLFLPPPGPPTPALLTPPPPPIATKTKSLRPWSTGTVRTTTARTRSTCTHKEKAVGTDSHSNDSIKQQWLNPSEHRSSDSTSDDSSDHYGKALKFYVEVTLKPSSNPAPEGILDCLIGEQTSVNLLRSGSSRIGTSEVTTAGSSVSSVETVVQVAPPKTLTSPPPTPTLATPSLTSEETMDQEWLSGQKSPTPSWGHFSPNPRIPSTVGHVVPYSQKELGRDSDERNPLGMRSSSPISSNRKPSTVGEPISAPVSFTNPQTSRGNNTQTTRRLSMSVIDRQACDDPPTRNECGEHWRCFQFPPRMRPQPSPVQPKESVAQVHQERRQKSTEQRPEANRPQPGSIPASTGSALLGRALGPTLGSLASAVTGLLATAVSCAQTSATNDPASPPTSKSLTSNVPKSSMPVTLSFSAPSHMPQQHPKGMSEGDTWDSVSLPPAVALRLKTARDFLRMRMVSLSHAKMPSVLLALQTHRDAADTAATALDAFRAKIYEASWAAGKDGGDVTPSAKALVHELTYRLTEAEKEARDLAIACRSLQLKMLGLTGPAPQQFSKVPNTPIPYVNLHSEQAFDEAAVIKYLDEIVQSLDMRVTGPLPPKT